jgi:threonine/homoserine/homoserine lactone efflux protein
MSSAIVVLSIATAIAVGAMSPGPSFVMVARTAMASTRSDGVAAALGMGMGGAIFSIAALLGLHALFASVPWIYAGMKIAGGLYLVYLGYRIWQGAKAPLMIAENAGRQVCGTLRRSFLLGLGTQLGNPKTAIVYASIFAALLPRNLPSAFIVVLPALIFCIEAGWYAIVAVMLSAASPRHAYLRYKLWVDRTAGGVMALLGLKLVHAAGEL